MSKISTKNLVITGMLTAIEIILSRFLSISAWNIKIGFSFVPIVVAAILLGPMYSAIVAGLGDLLGAILFPIGAYFPGFTFTAVITGLVFGIFLHKEQSIGRILMSVLINQTILSLLINTLWISILYGSPYGGIFVTRIAQTLILIVVEIVFIYAISQIMSRVIRSNNL